MKGAIIISIGTKVKLITFILSVTMLINILVSYYLVQDEKEDAKIINIAGKQRMLTQKMIVEFYRLTSGVLEAKTIFFKTQKEFNINLQRLRSGDLKINKNKVVSQLLDEVELSWHSFESLLLSSIDTKINLNKVYLKGNETLSYMEKAVVAYEKHATTKRDYINKIQLILGVFTLLVIFYMGFLSLGIHAQLSKFLKHSRSISGRKSSLKGNELDLAYVHIQYFLDDVELAIDSASLAVAQSEKASIQLASAKLDSKAIEHLDKSEDIVIEANEELYKTSILLKNLKTKLQDVVSPKF
ncbi:type IV pili methyl-accepting chemotaxis transducer N-terminal domain-containing protein [Sulfurimonas sp. MAG313]|nr:type IV pili methyl-accepting chemotaxis transducer N-terminal domain-containing protein [Sulfurimonas sp. MAG313]MDF1880579.1 type IV pili methyl-accepting chemotaxis transducer N-terminal domain-containing protein [Sulfurimonas sp. MAG313]